VAKNEADKKWIKNAITKRGAFSAKAEEAGMSTKAYADKVLTKNSTASSKTQQQARLARTLSKIRRG